MGEEELEKALAQGQAMSVEEAIAYALPTTQSFNAKVAKVAKVLIVLNHKETKSTKYTKILVGFESQRPQSARRAQSFIRVLRFTNRWT